MTETETYIILNELGDGNPLIDVPLGILEAEASNKNSVKRDWRPVAKWRLARHTWRECREYWGPDTEFRVKDTSRIFQVIQEWRHLALILKHHKGTRFPAGSNVIVKAPRYKGPGVVAGDSECPADHLAVRLPNGNVWFYPLECCSLDDNADAVKLAAETMKGK